MHFLDKRDDNGLLLGYSAHTLAFRISRYCFEKTEKTEIYKILKLSFHNDYLELFFKKLYYTQAKSIAGQIVINDWEIKNNTKNSNNKINIKLFPVEEYLQDFLILNNIKFKNNIDIAVAKIKISQFVRKTKSFLKRIIFKVLNRNRTIKNFNETMAISYYEGINLDKRSDLFWLEGSKINPDDIILYFDYYSVMTKFEKKKDLFKKIKKFKIRTVNPWEWDDNSEIDFLKELKIKLKNLNISNPGERSLQKISLELINEVKYWYLFFKKFNIKIHIDQPTVDNLNIIKQLALRKFGGCSVGKLRSVVGNKSYDYMGYFAQDILCVSSKDAHYRVKNNSFSKFQYSIITGYPYNLFTHNNQIEINKIKKFFDNNNKKFIILLVDDPHSDNKSSTSQILPTYCFYNYYNTLFDMASKTDDIGIIIKPKRISDLKKLNSLYDKALDLEKKGICYIVKDPFQKMPALYASIANLVIGTSCTYPSGLIESISRKKLGVYCDFANLKSIEKDWYSWGENKVIFNDVVKLSKKILEFKNDQIKHKYFGDWNNQKDILDPYQDDLGYKRIGEYLNLLLKGFKNKIPRSEAILMANNEFSKNWGKDKILKC